MSKMSEAAAIMGAKGGRARAERHDSRTLSKWARRGGKARAENHGPEELRAFAANAGRRPWKITPAVRRRILALLSKGWTHPRIAGKFGISLRAIGRLVAEERQGNQAER